MFKMKSNFKQKLRLLVSITVSLVLFTTPFMVKASPNVPNNFGAPAGFDWEAERQRQLKLFDELDKKIQAEAKKQNPNARFYINPRCCSNSEYRAERNRMNNLYSSSGGGGSDDGNVEPFPKTTYPGYVLATKDGTTQSSSSFIGHAGLVLSSRRTVESSPWENGVYEGSSEDWMGRENGHPKKSTLYILMPNVTKYPYKYYDETYPASDWAYTQIGKPYNWNYFDRKTKDSYYCSQLVWRAYLDKLDIDLCPGAWSWVSPGDIIESKELEIFYSWW